MKHILTLRVLPFFSACLILFMLQACKYETKNNFSLEETQDFEKQSIFKLLDEAKSLISKEKYEDAVKTLDSIINNYGTYEEVEDAYALKEDAQRRYVLKKIINSNNIDSLYVYITDYDLLEIKENAKLKIEEIIQTTSDPTQLQNFIDSNRLPEYRAGAKQLQQNLLKEQENELYNIAKEKNNAKTWKDFLAMYPNHPDKKQIDDTIIKLEVDEIFAGTYSEIPNSSLSGLTNYVNSDIQIKNDTPYTLTIRYSGKENKRVIITSGTTQKVNLKSGSYRVTASVNAARITNYAGQEILNGSYSSSYYVVN